tara:strand:+ start:82 stop:471 length:390 start_codon:yes stop_codon:yes gene_type:complete
MTYKINKELLQEIALQINSKKYTFKEVWDILDDFVNQGIEFDDGTTYESKWQDFLDDGESKTLADCIDEACTISGRGGFIEMIPMTDDLPPNPNYPNPDYESYHHGYVDGSDPDTNLTAIVNKTFINPK